MDPISGAERLKALLRERLKERAEATARAGASQRAAPPPMGLNALAAAEAADQHQLRRACVQTLLADAFGRGLLNDAGFQQVVGRVTAALSGDPDTLELLDRVVAEARPGQPARR